jgi:hypothetical protein
MGQMKDLTSHDVDEVVPETYIIDLADFDLAGQMLISRYSDRATIAYREHVRDRWSAPSITKRLI